MRKKDLQSLAATIADSMDRAKENGDPIIGVWFVADGLWYSTIAFNDQARKWYPNRLAWMQACGFEHPNYHAQSHHDSGKG